MGRHQLGSQEVYTTSMKAKVSRAPASGRVTSLSGSVTSGAQIVTPSLPTPNLVSSMVHKLHTNSFHVLEEVTPPDEVNQVKDHLLDAVPPDKFPSPEDIKDTNFEDDTDYDSPSTPVTIPFESYSSDLPTSERSKKQQKKAKKLARQRASSKITKGS